MNDKKYYWLKLKKDFFKRHDIKIIEAMPNGKDYILFYLKLLCESLDHNGNLRFSDNIPYSEEMLSVITNTNVDVVRSAIKVFTELNMMEILDDKTIYMIEVNNMLGSESESAERVRKHREKEKMLQCNANVTECNDNETKCNTEKDIDIDKEKDIDIDKELDYLNVKENKEKEFYENITYSTVRKFCEQHNLIYINPFKAIDEINDNKIENWQKWLIDENAKREI